MKPKERELELVAEIGKGLLDDFRDVSLFFSACFLCQRFLKFFCKFSRPLTLSPLYVFSMFLPSFLPL